MSQKIFQQRSTQATAAKLCFGRGPTTTPISKRPSPEDLRVDVHPDISHAGWAIANVQAKQGAQDRRFHARPIRSGRRRGILSCRNRRN